MIDVNFDNLSAYSVDELNQLSDQLDLEGLVLQDKKHKVSQARHTLVETQHAAYYGFTPDEYREVKRRAAEQGVSLNRVMAQARKARAVQVASQQATQVARAGVAEFGVNTVLPTGNG